MRLLVICFHSNKLVAHAWRRKDFVKIITVNSIISTFKINETSKFNQDLLNHSFIMKIKIKSYGVLLSE